MPHEPECAEAVDEGQIARQKQRREQQEEEAGVDLGWRVWLMHDTLST